MVVAATGGPIPPEWAEAESWLSPWVNSRALKSNPALIGDGDGFLKGRRPGAIHPLVLRILRPRVLGLLDQGGPSAAEAESFLKTYLVQTAVASSQLIPTSTPESALSAGALILAAAKKRGIVIGPDGQLQTPTGAESWTEPASRVLNTLVLNSEMGVPNRPTEWADRQARIRDLLATCPEWQVSGLGAPLRALASSRMSAAFGDLRDDLKAQTSNLPPDQFSTQIEFVASTDARPTAGQSQANDANRLAIQGMAKARGASGEAAQRRIQFENRLASPIAEPSLAQQLPSQPPPEGALGTYISLRLARLSPDALSELLNRGGSWDTSVNASIAATGDLPQAWARLEPWDGLRGRLAGVTSDRERAFAKALADRLPGFIAGSDAPPAGTDWNSIRPLLATVVHLGLPTGADLAALLARLDSLSQSAPDNDGRRLAAAAYIELKLTSLTSGLDSLPGPVFNAASDLDRFAALGLQAIDSNNAWEALAGTNALALLSRLACLSGDPRAAKRSAEFTAQNARASELVASTVARLLNPTPQGPNGSALALGVAASDLVRFARESAQRLDPNNPVISVTSKQPAWCSDSALPASVRGDASAITNAITTRFSDPSATPLRAFAWEGGRAGRTMLLGVFQVQLNTHYRSRRYTVEPLRADDAGLKKLQLLRATVRSIFCTERVLITGLNETESSAIVPWWHVGYWSAATLPLSTLPRGFAEVAGNDPNPRKFVLMDWAGADLAGVDEKQLALAADLEAAVPLVKPGAETDIDGLSQYALPRLTFQQATEKMKNAVDDLALAEQKYLNSLQAQDVNAASSEIISLLKKPLLFDTSDYTEQMQAAIAEVRQAEADLDASNHDSLASQLEACSVDLVYRSAQLEIKRQAVLKDVNALQTQSADLDTQIQNKVVEVANTDLEKKTKELDLAKLQNQKANIRLKMAARSRSHIRDEVKQLRDLLETPTPVLDPANGESNPQSRHGHSVPECQGHDRCLGLSHRSIAQEEAGRRPGRRPARPSDSRRTRQPTTEA